MIIIIFVNTDKATGGLPGVWPNKDGKIKILLA